MATRTLGGDRLGSGKKQQVYIKGYNRSTHDLSYLFRTTMSAGTLVPFLKQLCQPADTWDITLNCEILTHPTVGPLFGTYKIQLDVFEAPWRLYQARLHNNEINVGMNMANVKLPLIELEAPQTPIPTDTNGVDIDNCQINPSCLLAYLGIRGIGFNSFPDAHTRQFNGIPFLAYWDIYKNYYANKQEEIGAVIHTDVGTVTETVEEITINGTIIDEEPGITIFPVTADFPIVVTYTFPGPPPGFEDIIFQTTVGALTLLSYTFGLIDDGAGTITGTVNWTDLGDHTVTNWKYREPGDLADLVPTVSTFELVQIDQMRKKIFAHAESASAFDINGADLFPYKWVLGKSGDFYNRTVNQEGLGIKCYQSDLLNNWLNTEIIDGTNGINEVTSVSTTGDKFTIDALNLAKKVYELLNGIAASGGTYDDWQEVAFDHRPFGKAETPIYHGSLIKELGFQEVVSNAEVSGENGSQPLGTLAGRGKLLSKHKGGKMTIKCNEMGHIMGIVSITPRLDYSQGNDWDIHLKTMDDPHKPALDQIGFEDLSTELMAWWSTQYVGVINDWQQYSAGKQPAWTKYTTNINRVFGNFAIASNEMFMVLTRRFEFDNAAGNKMGDLTTYIDPVKFNHIFAQTSLDAMNFWVQISIDITKRTKMSAHLMPVL